jgi:hypothetical protein
METNDKDRSPLTRADIEAIMQIQRKHVTLLFRLKEAILTGDSLLEHEVARELVGLPKETPQ